MSHVTRTPRSKGQGRQAAILTAMLAHREAAAVGVGTCWPWETAAVLPSVRRRKALRRPRGSRGAGAYRGCRSPTACLELRDKDLFVVSNVNITSGSCFAAIDVMFLC